VLEDAIREIFSHNASGLSFEELYRRATLAAPLAGGRQRARVFAPQGALCSAARTRRARARPPRRARDPSHLRAAGAAGPARVALRLTAGALKSDAGLCRNAYNMVLHKFGDRLYNGLIATLKAHLRGVAAQVEQAHGVAFLPELRTHWQDHLKSMQMIRCARALRRAATPAARARRGADAAVCARSDILMYMDRTYVPQQDKQPVHELGLSLWKEQVVRSPRIRERLISTLLDLIGRERAGEAIDCVLVRSSTQMLSDLGLAVYTEDFERAFLAASAEFYASEAQLALGCCDCPEYLRRAELRLREEGARCKAYLDASSEAKITAVVEEQLLGRHVKTLLEMPNSGLVPMLMHDRYADLSRLYGLLRRPGVVGGLLALRTGMATYLRDTGRALVSDPERCREPADFVSRLLEEKDKYDALIEKAFAHDKQFQNAVNTSFEHFINLNPRSPEFISLFVDDLLRKGLKGASEEEAERLLDKVMMLFRYLQEKDVFEKYYKLHLAKRLLGGRTVSDDAERSFIVKLKTECGYQFTSKIEGMFTDIRTSRDNMAAFKAHLEESRAGGRAAVSADAEGGAGPSGAGAAAAAVDMGGVELGVQVLTTGSWPTTSGSHCNLPAELERCCEAFRSFYLSKHTGRRLVWQTNMGNADLRAQFGAARHELNVSTYQMCILLLFNTADSLTYAEIAEQTGVPSGDLKRNLQSLACVKGKNVLRKEPMGKDIEESDTFFFNDRFTCKLHKVKIGTVAAQKESEPEKLETRQRIEDDRKPQIEAAIVRIMKARRVLDHNTIISEVTKQLSSRFMPNPAVVKKRIESLIEREFLERGALLPCACGLRVCA
jgi:cullin 3